MSRDELLALAERVEALSGACLYINRAIAVASGQYTEDRLRRGNMLASAETPNQWGYYCPDYTASLDAAMSLAEDETELVDLLDEAREYTGRQGWSTGDFAGQLARNFVAEKLRALAAQQPSGAMTGE